ncbi:oligosaccharide flippase family protein [Deinococcus budaensis]|uniref:O-antigen/teichoic acid export membrane protein n=1 Tax=Deinococcus budaensis TaxID=1665626 RepID=A0A7W8GE73_9DEIO|nr:O-antigen/teichoic acid export membrane protein [Deinococcus budaensis]
MTELRDKTVRALKWSYLGFFVNLVFTPLSTALLSRLLTPGEFGVVAIASVLATFGAVVTELGVANALVQRRDLTPEHIRAAFTSSLVLGVVLTAVMWWAAPLVGNYTGNPDVVPVFRGFAATYVVASLALVSTSLLRRELRFKPLMAAEVGGYVIGHGVLGIGAAYLGFGAMSLVISAGASWAIQLAVSYAYVRHPFALTFRLAPYRDLYSFGVRASVLRLLEFFSGNMAVFVIARVFDAAALGLYRRAFDVAGMPVMRLSGGLLRVLVPSFSALQDQPGRLRRAYGSSLLALSSVLFTFSAGLFVCAPEIVRVLLGERFLAAVPIVQAFALYVPFPILANVAAIVAEATAKLDIKIALQVAQMLFLAAAFWVVTRLGLGVVAFAWVLVAGAVLNSLAYVGVAARILPGSGRESLRAYGLGLTAGLGVGAVLFAVVAGLRAAGTGVFVLFGLELVVGGLLVALVVFLGPDTELRRYALRVWQPAAARLAAWRAQGHT